MLTHECKGNASYKHLSIKQENIDLYYKNKPRTYATVPFYISYCTTIFAYRLCIYTMLSHIVRKNKLFRALCMMMLLLIHLDAYAYEVISACQVDTQDEMAIPSAADTFQEEDVNVLEWEDLSYSKTSVRSFFWWFVLGSLPLFFICFRNFIADISVIVRTVSLRVFPVRPYVTFCTLLI